MKLYIFILLNFVLDSQAACELPISLDNKTTSFNEAMCFLNTPPKVFLYPEHQIVNQQTKISVHHTTPRNSNSLALNDVWTSDEESDNDVKPRKFLPIGAATPHIILNNKKK